jgi:hypothetical protein
VEQGAGFPGQGIACGKGATRQERIEPTAGKKPDGRVEIAFVGELLLVIEVVVQIIKPRRVLAEEVLQNEQKKNGSGAIGPPGGVDAYLGRVEN